MTGANSSLQRQRLLSDSILWDNVEVGAGARVNRAVLADNVKIGADEVIENAVVVPRRWSKAKSRRKRRLPGHFQGENFIVPL